MPASSADIWQDAAWLTASRLWPVGGPTVSTEVTETEPRTAYRLVSSAVREAVASLGPLEAGIRDAAEAYRWHTPAEASRRFLAVVEGLRLLASVSDMAAIATGVNLTDLCGANGTSGVLDEMGRALDQLTAQQFAEDWPAVAVTLESELIPSLAGWREVLTSILLQADFRFRERRPH